MTRKPMTRAEVAVVKVQCVGCGDERDIHAGEVPAGEQPVCENCFMPMIAVSARLAKERAMKEGK